MDCIVLRAQEGVKVLWSPVDRVYATSNPLIGAELGALQQGPWGFGRESHFKRRNSIRFSSFDSTSVGRTQGPSPRPRVR